MCRAAWARLLERSGSFASVQVLHKVNGSLLLTLPICRGLLHSARVARTLHGVRRQQKKTKHCTCRMASAAWHLLHGMRNAPHLARQALGAVGELRDNGVQRHGGVVQVLRILVQVLEYKVLRQPRLQLAKCRS